MKTYLCWLVSVLLVGSVFPPARAAEINVPNPDVGIYTIQDGIDAASPGDEVIVAPGSYEAVTMDKAITLRSSEGPEETTISGAFATPAVLLSGSGIVRGFTLTSGSVVGGIRITSGFPVIEENIIENNGGLGLGGGINGTDASPIIRFNTIRDNSSYSFTGVYTVYGGGIRLVGDGIVPQIYNNFIENNRAECVVGLCTNSYGGGIYVQGGSPRIIGNVLAGNRVNMAGYGGAICVLYAENAVIANNTAYDNESPVLTDPVFGEIGGTIYLGPEESSIRLSNNIIQGNHGRGVLCSPGTNVTIETNSLYDNTDEDYVDCPAGTGDLFVDAEMLDPASGEYHLAETSPLIDAGTSGLPGLPLQDVYGEARFSDGDGNGSVMVDVGADEFNPVIGWGPASAQAGTSLYCQHGTQGSVATNYLAAILFPLGLGTMWSILSKRGLHRISRR